MTVLSTTRNPDKAGALIGIGVDHVLIDDGQIARHVHDILPGGVDTALELVEAPTLPDTLRAARVHGGGLLHRDAVQLVDRARLLPIEYIPRGVGLTSYGGDATDLPAHVLQEYLDSVEAGQAVIPIDHFYTFDQIVEAHTAMEAGPCAREARRDHMTDRGENESPASGPIANCAECHHGFYLLRATEPFTGRHHPRRRVPSRNARKALACNTVSAVTVGSDAANPDAAISVARCGHDLAAKPCDLGGMHVRINPQGGRRRPLHAP